MRGAKPTTFAVIQGGIVDAVEPPRDLPADCHEDWNTVTADLASRKLLNEVTLTVVAKYCRNLWIGRLAAKSIEEDGLYTKGGNGSLKSNPAVTALQKAEIESTRLAVELGLTPSSRSRKGLEGSGGAPTTSNGVEDFL